MIAPPSTALLGLVLGACILAAASDAVSRRIPNLIPLAILTAIVFERAHQGWWSLGSGFGALAIVLIIGTFAHAHGWFGGGDVKLAAAVAALSFLQDEHQLGKIVITIG